jgi:DNA polymerase-3 subunit beta
MKAKVSTRDFSKLLSLASSVSPRKPTIPALGMARLQVKVEGGQTSLQVQATDMELAVATAIPCEEAEAGSCAAPAYLLAEISKVVSDEHISLALNKQTLHISCADGQFKTVILGDESDFPTFPEIKAESTVVLPHKDLMEMVRLTSFAVSTDAVRYALTGILIELDAGFINTVASDGRRLAWASRKLEADAGKVKVILPPRVLELTGQLFEPEAMLIVSIAESSVSITDGSSTIHSRVVDGSFPDYRAVVPKDEALGNKIKVSAGPLRDSLRRVSLMTSDRAPAVKLTTGKQKLVLSSRCADVGEGEEVIPAECGENSFSIIFNPRYLLDYLKANPGEEVEIGCSTPQAAARITTGRNGHVYVLMPLAMDV